MTAMGRRGPGAGCAHNHRIRTFRLFSSQEPFLILSPMHNSCQLAALGVFKYLITPRKSFKKTVSTFNLKLNRKPQLGLEPVE